MKIIHLRVLLLALALAACDTQRPESKLETAADEVRIALEEKTDAVEDLTTARDRLQTERQQVEAAERELQEARKRLRARQKSLTGEQRELDSVATDTAIYRLLQSRLLNDSELANIAVGVSVTDGHVTLYGDAAEVAQIHRAEKIAANVPGVTQVNNLIEQTGNSK